MDHSQGSFLRNKTVLVTGGAGTVGRELIRQALSHCPKEMRVIDVNESELFFLEEEFGRKYRETGDNDGENKTTFQAYVGDIRDADKLNRKMEGVDIVFHAAALKHVILCERSPFDAVQTNILGTKNVINAALLNKVGRVIFTSSDKAVNPTSVMGTSKLMAERLITAANNLQVTTNTVFSSTRFGNVIGSRGSVAPIFYNQIKKGADLTLTDRSMTRFIMTAEESVRLVLRAAELAKGGEVFVTKMPILKICDLATAMIDILAPKFGRDPKTIAVKCIGVKAGEKMYEELMSEEEAARALELEDMFVVMPAFRSVYEQIDYDYPGIVSRTVPTPYVSAASEHMTVKEIGEYIRERNVIEKMEECILQ